jgi:hypothetical protein
MAYAPTIMHEPWEWESDTGDDVNNVNDVIG